MSKIPMLAAFAILSLILLGGLYILFKGVLNIQRSIASQNWPKTVGAVLRSETTRDVTSNSRRNSASVTFNTRTIVRYEVNGRHYTTDIEHFGQTLGSGDASEAAVKRLRYPEGKAVSVSYNPGSPDVAVVRPGLHSDAFWLPGAGLAFALPVALCMWIVPAMFAQPDPDAEKAFEQSVQKAIDDGRRGISPRADFPQPPSMGGDKVMPLAAGFMGALACGLGLLALTSGLQRYWEGNASLSWPTTPGSIVVASKADSDDDAGLDSGTDTAWYARFVYQYTVGGVDHFNNRRRFANVEGGGGDDKVQSLRDRYKKGATVKVSYSPADPDVAVLEPGNSGDSLIIPGIGVALLLFGSAIFIWVVPGVMR